MYVIFFEKVNPPPIFAFLYIINKNIMLGHVKRFENNIFTSINSPLIFLFTKIKW